MPVGEQQHKYSKLSIRDINTVEEVVQEISRVKDDIDTISTFRRFDPDNIRMDLDELESYRRYLMIKWLDLLNKEMGGPSPPKPPHANYPEYYEYLKAEKGILVECKS